jgi:hypothetical protein
VLQPKPPTTTMSCKRETTVSSTFRNAGQCEEAGPPSDMKLTFTAQPSLFMTA